MRKGLNSLADKQRRAARRTNHFSLDRDRDHKVRVIPNKKRNVEPEWDNQDWERFVEEDPYWLHKHLGLTTKE
jgi:hypothetical protein